MLHVLLSFLAGDFMEANKCPFKEKSLMLPWMLLGPFTGLSSKGGLGESVASPKGQIQGLSHIESDMSRALSQ